MAPKHLLLEISNVQDGIQQSSKKCCLSQDRKISAQDVRRKPPSDVAFPWLRLTRMWPSWRRPDSNSRRVRSSLKATALTAGRTGDTNSLGLGVTLSPQNSDRRCRFCQRDAGSSEGFDSAEVGSSQPGDDDRPLRRRGSRDQNTSVGSASDGEEGLSVATM